MTLIRRAGTGRTAAGDVVTWVVAEGRRGRRWRESVAGPGGLRHSLLLETGPERRFSHLELATPAGLLTLHPEPDGTLHGNIVEAAGIRHVSGLAWDADGAVVVAGSPVAAAAAAHLARPDLDAGASVRRTVLRITTDLLITAGSGTLERLDADTWRLAGDGPFRVDADGLPVIGAAATWPLERGPEG